MPPLDRLYPRAGPTPFFSLHSAARQASHPNFLLLGFRASPKFPPSCVIPRVAFSKTLEPRQGFQEAQVNGWPRWESSPRRPEDPQDKSQERKPQKAKRKGLPPKRGARPQRVSDPGFRVFFVVQRISVRWAPGPQ